MDSRNIPDKQARITPAQHLQAALAAKQQREDKRRAHLAQAREWAEERRKHAIPPHHPAYEFVAKRLEQDREFGYKVNEPWCYEARLKQHLIRWHQLTYSPTGNVVYYIKVSKYIKIGTTKDVDRRVQGYPPDSELLATEPGGYRVEAMRHQQFRKHLAARQEWFEPAPELMRHIAGLQRAAVEEFETERETA